MAYVLGFFTADGSMIKNKRGAHFIEFYITDKGLLEKIRKLLGSNYKISLNKRSEKYKTSYRLQIGSKAIFNDLLSLGLTPCKSNKIALPDVPTKYFSHFTRGYFDGDGGVWCGLNHKKDRKIPTRILISTFTSGSKKILQGLAQQLYKLAGVRLKQPTSQNGAFRLSYSTNDSRKIYNFIYNRENDLFLRRKKIVFEKYLRA